MRASTLASILAFGVLADDDPVEVACICVAKRRLGSFQNLRRPNIGELLERLADC